MPPIASFQNLQGFYSLSMAGLRDLFHWVKLTDMAVLRTDINRHFTKELGKTVSWFRELLIRSNINSKEIFNKT